MSKNVKYPLATLAPYGPTDQRATKLVVAIFPEPQAAPTNTRRWFVDSGDVRENATVNREVTAFLKEHQVVHASMADRIMGCPHEEGIDYRIGTRCPFCAFWSRANRFPEQRELKAERNDPCPCGSGKKYKKCCGSP